MLGEVIARVDGRAWEESLQARILDPLGMRRTTIGLDGTAAVGYYVPAVHRRAGVEPLLDVAAMDPAGGLASTVTDMATWGHSSPTRSTRSCSPDSLDEMCQPQIVADLDKLAAGLGSRPDAHARRADRVWVGHTGGMPGHITGLCVHRQSKTVAITLINSPRRRPVPSGLAIQLGWYVIDNEPRPGAVVAAGTAVPAELVGLLGRWFSEGRGPSPSACARVVSSPASRAPPRWMPPSVFVELDSDLYRTESGREKGELLRINRAAEASSPT